MHPQITGNQNCILLHVILCFSIVILRLLGKNRFMKNEKWILYFSIHDTLVRTLLLRCLLSFVMIKASFFLKQALPTGNQFYWKQILKRPFNVMPWTVACNITTIWLSKLLDSGIKTRITEKLEEFLGK